MKHIKIHYHFIRERVLVSDINRVHVNTRQHIANVFTKALGSDKHEEFKRGPGVQWQVIVDEELAGTS